MILNGGIMSGFPLLFGIHCHQPVDNFHNVVDDVIDHSYKPFFEKTEKYPFFKFSAHFSGWLLEYIEKYHAGFFAKMVDMAERGQVEFFTGGFYEPVLASIPSADRVQQIQKLSGFIRDNFKQEPKGLWLTERVWDPSIVKDLVECGIEYVIVDDYHLLVAGFKKDDVYGYYYTEQDGKLLSIFPVDKKLRYIIPFADSKDIFDYIHEIRSKPESSAAIIFDDGEKFGTWPKTYQWVYDEGWFDSFLEKLNYDDNIKSMTYKEFFDSNKPNGLAYMPTTSYYEMGEWSLSPEKYSEIKQMKKLLKLHDFSDDIDVFVRGATWHSFFVKYPEMNMLHKRILYFSKKRCDVADMFLDDFIFRGECNDVFWHGIFGGVYLPNLRDNAFKYLILAEKRYEHLIGKSYPFIWYMDIDLNGYDEIFLTEKNIQFMFNTKEGGSLQSVDIRDMNFNLSNTLTRRKESYHTELLEGKNIEEEKGISTIHEASLEVPEDIKEQLTFDWHMKYSFMDHFVKSLNEEEFVTNSYTELGDFVNQPFSFTTFDYGVTLTRNGGIYPEEKKYDTSVEKMFELENNGLVFDIVVETAHTDQLYYGIEFNFHFFDYEKVLINGEKIDERSTLYGSEVVISDESINKTLKLGFNEQFDMKYFVLKTVSQSESGVDLTSQGLSIIILFKLNSYINIKGNFIIEDSY
ncbi:MAG: DUF1926 domain-containing protein [Flexistipes sinusarabici]|uniref:DUF1926 domain-containing protein n=2 Tax=Flexistipes sinusarabici TaxID=2352 RepID=A0A5D0MNN1_FLESI|nr:MAG: DUF1926 domain-containing protein [Flexistipes sinusarabici]